MAQRDNILQELNELGSSLSTASSSSIYQVPAGYFASLADKVMSRIRALEAADPKEELAVLSPFLASIPKVNPYQVPSGYFETLTSKQEQDTEESPEKELESLSPLLSGLKKQTPYAVPDGYFEKLNIPVTKEAPAKIIRMGSRKLFRYAAAAVIIGFVAIGALLIFTKRTDSDTSKDSLSNWAQRVNTEQLDQFIDMAEEDAPVLVSNDPSNEVKDLVKSISEEDMNNFLDDARIADADADEDILFN